MVNYTCPICNKEFNKKSNFIEHTEKKKKPCKPNLQEFAENSKNLQEFAENAYFSHGHTHINPEESNDDKNNCIYCNKKFSSIYTLNRHLNNGCKKKIEYIENSDEETKKENKELKKKIEIQEEKIENQNKQIEELKKMFYEFSKQNKKINNKIINNKTINNTDNSTNIQNNTTNTSNTQNNNINIILPHGKEFEKVELKDVLDQMITYDFNKMVPNRVKHIYLNKDKPENQNFIVNDMARNKCQYYDGKKWITGKANEKLLGIFENTNSLFTDPFDEPEAIKTVKFIRENKKYAEKYPTILKCRKYAKDLFNEWDKESMESRQKILDELKLIFYNHREEILKIEI